LHAETPLFSRGNGLPAPSVRMAAADVNEAIVARDGRFAMDAADDVLKDRVSHPVVGAVAQDNPRLRV